MLNRAILASGDATKRARGMRMAGRRSFLSRIRFSRSRFAAGIVVVSSIVFVGFNPTTALGAPNITGVQPDCADHGGQAALVGSGLDENIVVSVGGKRATIVEQTDTAITFVVPNGAKAGDTKVVAVLVSRGNREEVARLPFRVASDCPTEGVLLEGPLEGNAFEAITTLPGGPVPPDDVDNGLILTRLNVAVRRDATIGEINGALEGIGALIVGMREGVPFLDVAIAKQTGEAALQQLADTLTNSSGVALSWISREPAKRLLPPGGAGTAQFMGHLRNARFPAAWNAMQIALGNCGQRVQIVVPDEYAPSPPSGYEGFFDQVPHFSSVGQPSTDPNETHGFDVVTTMAALFDELLPTGANPFSDCMDVRAVRQSGNDWTNMIQSTIDTVPTGQNVIISNSLGYEEFCGNPGIPGDCTPNNFGFDAGIGRFADAAFLRSILPGLEDRLLITTSAGNELDDEIAAVYGAAGDAFFDSPYALAATVGNQPTIAGDPLLWSPTTPCTGTTCFPNRAASQTQINQVHEFLEQYGFDGSALDSVLIVGSATANGGGGSSFSDVHSNVFAIGEAVTTFAGTTEGTSFTSPQVAGLASYLWLLSPTLRDRPVQDTLATIAANTFQPGSGKVAGLINAYQTVLSLDDAVAVSPTSSPIRRAIMDVDDNGRFELTDITEISDALINGAGAANDDLNRYDLNGDGLVGGSATTAFDLDPNGSTKFGAPRLETVSQSVGLFETTYDETALTDEQVLCYYSWSDLFEGTDVVEGPDPRIEELQGQCDWEGAFYEGTITWIHDQAPFDADTFSAHWEVVADITMELQDDLTLTPSGTITYDGLFQSQDPSGEGGICTETDHGSGAPTGYTGTFTSEVGSLSGTVSGTRTFSGGDACSGGPFPITVSFDGDAEATHVYENGVLTRIDFTRTIFFDDGETFVNSVFQGELVLTQEP